MRTGYGHFINSVQAEIVQKAIYPAAGTARPADACDLQSLVPSS
ncbi:hypothetical protein [Nonomuraea sp. NPDC049480]